jgi:hypothetical protein
MNVRVRVRCGRTLRGYVRAFDATPCLVASREEAKVDINRFDRFLDGAADGRRDAARTPVETKDAAKRLKPERIGKTRQNFAGTDCSVR